jgi:hypothetical protein
MPQQQLYWSNGVCVRWAWCPSSHKFSVVSAVRPFVCPSAHLAFRRKGPDAWHLRPGRALGGQHGTGFLQVLMLWLCLCVC